MLIQCCNRTLVIGAFLVAAGLLMNPRAGSAAEGPALRELAQQRGFSIGAAVAMPLLDNADYRKTLSREFNLCVAENAFKMESFRPARDKFDFRQLDRLCAFAQTNRMKLQIGTAQPRVQPVRRRERLQDGVVPSGSGQVRLPAVGPPVRVCANQPDET